MTRRLQRYRTYLVAVGVALMTILALWVAIAVILLHNRDELKASAQTDAMNGARIFAEHIRRTVTMIDLALQDYRDYHRSHSDAPLAEGWRDAYLKEGGVFQWAVIDAQGMMVFSNLTPSATKPVDLSDREHFTAHRDREADELFISKPLFGRVSGRWAIQFTRRLSSPDGGFNGVVVFSIGPEYFVTNFEALDIGQSGVTLLAGMDRVVRARFTHDDHPAETLGMALPSGYPFFDPERPTGVTSVISFADAIERVSAWRQVSGYPLVVAVQVAKSDILSQAIAVERNLLVVGVLISGVLVAAALSLAHLWERRALAQRQLERQAAELSLANEEIERLAYVAAHDLQEPLRAITSFSQLTYKTYADRLDEEGKGWLMEVTAATGRMKLLLRDIQLYLGEKSLPPPVEPIESGEVMRAILAKLQSKLERAGGRIEVGPLPVVLADGRRLREILSVLLENAILYRAADRPLAIRVTSRREGGFHVIDVADNGVGIDPAYLERIFEVFQRLHSRAEHPGTGMGLAIARKMARRLGGRIEAASKPGDGSVFSVYFPDINA